jgi:ribosomal protein S18 acetylase RimI-like enzyme
VDGTTLAPASTLTREQLVAVFNEGYEGYYVPVQLDADALGRHLGSGDVDLEASRVALRGTSPLGFCVLGVRGDEGWIGGMGVATAARRRGIGEALLRAVIDEARARGLRRIVLEVLEQNEPARRLYERLGFEHVRDLEIWSLEDAPPSAAGHELPRHEAETRIRAHRTTAEPW